MQAKTNYEIKLTVQNKTLRPNHEDKCLLDTLKKHDVHIEFQCTEGFCGACRTKKIKGEVSYSHEPLAYLHSDDILPCCCVALTDLELEL